MKIFFKCFLALSNIFCFCLLFSSSNKNVNVENFIGLFCKSKGLVFDIGANVGSKTELYLKHGARVISVEPQPKCIDILKKRYGENENVIIVDMAVDKKCGTLEMYICTSEDDSAISSFSDKWVTEGRFSKWGYKWKKQIKVNMTTLDELIKLYGVPNFCKIDVENFEVPVLSGLSTPIPLLSFEFHTEFIKDAEKCMDLLKQIGDYKFNIAFGVDADFAFEKWQSSKSIIKTILKYAQTHPDVWGDIYALQSNDIKKNVKLSLP